MLDNAERYGAPPFVLTLWRDVDTLHLRVDDHGPGVPPRLLDVLGQPFLRGDNARGGAGTGLGLTIAARTAKMHGGRLHLRNAEGGGFRAELELTAAPPEQAATTRPSTV